MSEDNRKGDIHMKNKEKYAKEIVEIACDGNDIAFNKNTGKLESCGSLNCHECLFSRYDNKSCGNIIREWAESEYIEKPVISKRDKAFFEYLDKQYEYLARDKTGQLYVHRVKPHKVDGFWTNVGRRFCLNDRINVDFPMVKWEDSEPCAIEDLKKLEVVEEYG